MTVAVSQGYGSDRRLKRNRKLEREERRAFNSAQADFVADQKVAFGFAGWAAIFSPLLWAALRSLLEALFARLWDEKKVEQGITEE